MLELSLPGFDYKVKKQNGTVMIFDIVRKKYVVLKNGYGNMWCIIW